MHFNTALLALPAALLISVVTAVPSPPPYAPRHLFSPPTSPSRSGWRRLSDKLIDSVFQYKYHSDKQASTSRLLHPDRQAPPHIFARHGSDVVLRFNVSTAEEVQSLAEAADTLILDVWEYAHDWVDIRLSKDIVAPLLGLLPASLQHAHTPLLRERELAQAIYDTYPAPREQTDRDAQSASTPASPYFGSSLRSHDGEQNIFFADYQPLSVIDPWMRLIASLFTTHVRKVTIGISAQGRDIVGLRVGVHPTNNNEPPPRRKTVLITGGSHAREWISTATVNYIAYSLITSYGKTKPITSMLEAFDFVFVPSLNPDGYAYTWSTDRLWRKNRQTTNFRLCRGIDIDRSFGFAWDGFSTTAGNPCSESFAGEESFAAIESKALADWARNETERNNVEFVAFLDLHSYSQEILYPYSYSCDAEPPGLENMQEVGFGLEKAIRQAGGQRYEVLPACEGNVASTPTTTTSSSAAAGGKRPPRFWPRMEASGGSALDWFYHEMKVRYAYQIKLRDRGAYGFLLPKENIVPTGREILDAVVYLGGFLGEVYGADTEEEEKGLGRGGEDEQDGDESEWVKLVGQDGVEEVEFGPGDVQWDLRRRRR
ncbi:hypothetical protein LTR62_002833 [Meristemomyces frigidus]|uniref:Inactive metallocarboxypeptidase ECM14 n=1 Tax=Meristemomyces frigidus TaxID=1508187 RepID=A0AAN7TWZ1_9PEZI|nr:hypothetical protein LTR62_002833 [Meristemomyces frigidus]